MPFSVFAREGWITHGNPNHYSSDGLLLRELRARARDTDPDAVGANSALETIETDAKEHYGKKLTESTAVELQLADVIADYLSDMCPDGYAFEIRSNAGNSNYGYFRRGEDPWLTRDELADRLSREYGDAGVFALETGDVGDEDLDLGYEHCLGMILPALEEELIANGEL